MTDKDQKATLNRRVVLIIGDRVLEVSRDDDPELTRFVANA